MEKKKHVEELLKLGVVRPSSNRFNSPMFVVAKKDGGVWIFQEICAIIQLTMVDKYSMRDVQKCDEIGQEGSTIFSTIDLRHQDFGK
jgi:hypothetical protein